MVKAFKTVAQLICLGVLLQAAFIAAAWFQALNEVDDGLTITKDYDGNTGHMLHGVFGMMVLPLLGLVLFILAFLVKQKVPQSVKWGGLTFLAIVVQVVLAFVSFSVPVLGALHGINAFLVFGLALNTAKHATIEAVAGASAGAPATV
jgi:hypothetical protein